MAKKQVKRRITYKSRKTKITNNRGFLFYLGNSLIIASIALAFVVIYPIVSVYLFPNEIVEASNLEGDYITIHKINPSASLSRRYSTSLGFTTFVLVTLYL